MKKFIFRLPLVSLVLGAAIAAVASTGMFKNSHKHAEDTYAFEYIPPASDPYSAANVHNVDNWQYTSSPNPCGGSDKACTILVPVDYVNNPTTSPQLDASINIGTSMGAGGDYYVSSTAAGANATIANQAD